MSDSIKGQLIVAVTAVVSGALGLVGGLLIEHLRTLRDRAGRIEQRQDQKDEFQRQTLLEIQEAVARYGRLVGRVNYHDSIAFKETGTWMGTQVGHELSEDLLAARVRLQLLQERARDDELTKLVTVFSNRGSFVTIASSKEEATLRMDDLIESLTKVQERLGTVLRTFM